MAQLSQRLDKEIYFYIFFKIICKCKKCLLTKQVAVKTRQFDINAEDPAMMVDPPEVGNYKRSLV